MFSQTFMLDCLILVTVAIAIECFIFRCLCFHEHLSQKSKFWWQITQINCTTFTFLNSDSSMPLDVYVLTNISARVTNVGDKLLKLKG